MLRFADGFDHYPLSQISIKWTAYYVGYGDASMDATGGRRGKGCLKSVANNNSASLYVRKVIDAQVYWAAGIAFYISSLPTSEADVCVFEDIGSVQVHFMLETDGTIKVYRGSGTSNLLGTSTSGIITNSWNYLEFYSLIDSTAGTAGIKLNGGSIMDLTGKNTKATSNSTANGIKLGIGGGMPNFSTMKIDDVYILDGQGSVNNAPLGDVRIDAYLPSGNGAHSDFMGSDGNNTDNYLLVNEASMDSDTSYVQSSTVNHIDSYPITGMVHTPENIFGVILNLIAKKDDSGTRTVAGIIRRSSTDYAGSAQNLSASYLAIQEIHETDPSTSAAWTKTGFNAAEFGIKVID